MCIWGKTTGKEGEIRENKEDNLKHIASYDIGIGKEIYCYNF